MDIKRSFYDIKANKSAHTLRMYFSMALDTTHLLCYYVCRGRDTPTGMKPHMQTELQTQAQRRGLKSVPDQQVNKTYTLVKYEEGFPDYY